MYYGYIDYRITQDTLVIITKPCKTITEANEEYTKAYNNLPKSVKIDIYGRNNGTLSIEDDIKIPNGYYGIKIKI